MRLFISSAVSNQRGIGNRLSTAVRSSCSPLPTKYVLFQHLFVRRSFPLMMLTITVQNTVFLGFVLSYGVRPLHHLCVCNLRRTRCSLMEPHFIFFKPLGSLYFQFGIILLIRCNNLTFYFS